MTLQSYAWGWTPFDAAWQRAERAYAHRKAAADVWNTWLEDEPYRFVVNHEGEGQFSCLVVQEEPTPPEMAVRIGEWLYNLRCALDYAVYDAAICVSGKNPPPKFGQLQCPVYFAEDDFRKNEYRLKPLADQHRALLERIQPYRHDDPDTSALGCVHKLARIDRHRSLHVMTAYAAEVSPLITGPMDASVEFEPGERVVIDGEAEIARFKVTPWSPAWDARDVKVNPRTGLDPEMAEMAESPFWSRFRYDQRLRMLEFVIETIVVPLEYDCIGYSRKADFLTEEFRAECDARRETRQRTGHW